jgi:hypothetical protein
MITSLKHSRLAAAAIAAVLLWPLGMQAQAPAPARVVARETAPGVITVSWSSVAGVAEYFIGRSVWPDGFRRAATVKDTFYVDTAARAGVRHVYTVNVVGSPRRGRSRCSGSQDAGVSLSTLSTLPRTAPPSRV